VSPKHRAMKYVSFLCLCSVSLLLCACNVIPTATATEVAMASPAATQVSSPVVQPTTMAPEEMPTAVPIWTETPTPQPQALPTAAPTPAETSDVPLPVPEPSLDPEAIAMVNDSVILRSAYQQRVSESELYLLKQPGFDPKSTAAASELTRLRLQVLEWMIDQVLIEQAAAREAVVVSDAQVEGQLAAMRGQDARRFANWLEANGLTVESLGEQVRTDLLMAKMRDRVTLELSRQVEQVHVRHILLSEETAASNAQQRLTGGENFIMVAREVSEDEGTRTSGGDLGFVPRGVMPPEFEDAAFALSPGEISQVIRSASGFHIVQLIEIDPQRPVPDELWPIVQQRAFEDWLASERAKASIIRAPGSR